MKKTFKFLTCLFVALLCFGQMWGTDYTIYQATSSGVNCANVTETGISVTFNSMKGISNSPITSVANTTYGIESGLKAPRWGGSGDGKNIAIVVTGNYTATITAYVQVNTASQTVTIKQTTESGTNVASVSCSAIETVYQVQATDLAAGTYYIKANDKVGLIKLVASVTAAGGGGGSATPTHSVTVTSNNDSYGTAAAASTTVAEGSTTTITATPNSGYKFKSWAVSGTGSTLTSTSTNPTTLTMGYANTTVTATFEEKPSCPSSGTLFSASVAATSDQSIDAGASDLVLTAAQATVTGGSMSVYNGQGSAKTLIDDQSSTYYFAETNGNTFFRVRLNCELQAGDEIKAYVFVGKDEARGLWFAQATSYPSSAPTAKATRTNNGWITYTVTEGDGIIGETDFSIFRATSNTTYFGSFSITRPEKFDVTYYKNDGTDASSVAKEVAVVGDNTFTRSGYRFIEWNTQADGKGTKVNVGASVTANMQLYAIWAQEYSVSYANTGAASGAAPTNTNKYITDEKFKVAGIGTMVAPSDHVFGGWNDGSATYQENDDYTVGSANVAFAPVWTESFNVYYYPNGGGGTAYTAENSLAVKECFFAPPTGKLFDKWTTNEDGTGIVYDPGATVTTSINLYAQWKDDECTARQSLIAMTFTGDKAATAVVNGYNEKEYVDGALIKNLGDNNGPNNGGYKIYSDGGYVFATIAKGNFQEGDKLEVEVTVVPASQKLDVYAYGDNIASAYKVVSIEQVSAAGTYTYALTAANATAINTLGYKSLGVYRASGSNMNAFVKSLSITGCRSWSIYHTLTFKNVDGTATIATENLAEGDLARTVAPSAPVIEDKYFAGWSESIDGTPVDMSAYTITEDKILYAVYEDCPTYGTIFKFAVATGKTNGNIFAQTPNSLELTTENYLSELENGTVTAAVTGSSNDRIRYNDGMGLEFNGDNKGALTISMDCPMKTGDVVRIINYAASGNKLKLSANSLDVQVDGNGAETIQTVEVPAEWNNQRTLVLSRGNKNPKFTYVEIYRRPVLSSVTLEDLNLKVGKTGTPSMTLNPEGAIVTSEAWAITASTATGTTINAETGLITAGETAGQLTVQVTLNGDKVATCTVKVVPGFEAPKPVTETTTWNWATLAVAAGDGPQIANPDTVLANYLSGEEWETLSGNAGGRPYRKNPDYMCYQGTSLSFTTTKPGILTLKVGYTSSDKVCDVSVNGHVIGSTPATPANLNSIVVPAGDVYISATSMRIYWMKFDTDLSAYTLEDNLLGGYERTLTAGNYGTICLPNSGVMSGASIFEIAYFDNAQRKIFFDEVVDGHMVAGRPHIFLPNEGETELKVYHTDQANTSAGDYRGLYGFFDTSDDNAIKKLAENDYFLYNN